MDPFFDRNPCDEFSLLSRVQKCFRKWGIEAIGELVQKSEQEMLRIQNFGPMCLENVTAELATKGLRLGMRYEEMEEWTPEEISKLIAKAKHQEFLKHYTPSTQAWGWDDRQELSEDAQASAMLHILECGDQRCKQARDLIFAYLKKHSANAGKE